MKLVYVGTSAFAIPALQAVIASPHHVLAVITQPDRPAGRGRAPTPPPIALCARQHGLPVWQPSRLNDPEFLDPLTALQPDLMVVAAYGKLIPPAILQLPRRGCINIHPSLLPKYRGAAPINWAILHGDATTGISIIEMVEAMDAGDILLQMETPIAPEETAAALHDRLAQCSASLLLDTIAGLAAGTITPHPQDKSRVTLAPKLSKEQGRIDWQQPATTIINQIRGLQPWPGTYTQYRSQLLKIWAAEIWDAPEAPRGGHPGEIIGLTRSIQVATGTETLCLTEVQLEGKQRLRSEDFLRGYPITMGEVLT